MQTIAPEPAFIIARAAARVHRNAERRLSRIVKSHASAVISQSFMLREPPTLLTNTSRRPYRAMMRAKASSTAASSVTSATIERGLPLGN